MLEERVEPLNYTFHEVCRALRLGEHSVRALMRRSARPLPHFRAGGRVMFPREGVRRWLVDESIRAEEDGACCAMSAAG